MAKEIINPSCASVENCLNCSKECPIGPVVVLPERKLVANKGVVLETGRLNDANILPLETKVVLEVQEIKDGHYLVKMAETANGGKKIEGTLYLAAATEKESPSLQ